MPTEAPGKLRGSKLDLLVLDEMQKFHDRRLRRALELVIPATLVSRRGRFAGIGTPDELCSGLLYDICERRLDAKYSLHHWDAGDNTINSIPWEGLLLWKAER